MNEHTTSPESVIDQLTEEGFLPGAPAHVSRWAQQCDHQAARESACPRCGQAELTYIPLHQDTDYRAVARCECCLHELEF